MNVYAVVQRGEYHLNTCEDHLITTTIGRDKIVCAVMDGCTNGIESHFASTLVGKLLRKICLAEGYKELYKPSSISSPEIQLKTILNELFRELNITKSQLLLDEKELLTTLIILLANKQTGNGIVMAIGDGIVSINGTTTNFDQDNKPDYLGFHLDDNFDTWYNGLTQKLAFDRIHDISIATDGIETFTRVAKPTSIDEIDPIRFLTQNDDNRSNEDMLYMKLKTLEHKYGQKATDDLAMIRIINK